MVISIWVKEIFAEAWKQTEINVSGKLTGIHSQEMQKCWWKVR